LKKGEDNYHTDESRYPEKTPMAWIPASAGMAMRIASPSAAAEWSRNDIREFKEGGLIKLGQKYPKKPLATSPL